MAQLSSLTSPTTYSNDMNPPELVNPPPNKSEPLQPTPLPLDHAVNDGCAAGATNTSRGQSSGKELATDAPYISEFVSDLV